MKVSGLGACATFLLLQENLKLLGEISREAYKSIYVSIELETSKVMYHVCKKCSDDKYSETVGYYDNIKGALDNFNSIKLD